MLVSTLKEFLSNIQLNATKATEEAEPASFVNYTISRSLSVLEREEEEAKSITKRSVDLSPHYTKHSGNEKGCSFGLRQYKVGEQIKTDDECLECFCNYAPIGHCIRKEKCIV
jgi:arginyl-tRNA synthetase